MNQIRISKNLTFATDFGEIAYDIYEPLGQTESKIIQISHGMQEHKARYEWIANTFAKLGYIVAISDHRGHGESINAESGITLGEMGEQGFAKATYDLYKLNRILKEQFQATKMILLGHSMGSLLARRYIQLYSESIQALILSGSPAYNANIKYGIFLGKFFEFFNAKHLGAKVLNALCFNGFNKRFKKMGDTSFGWLCSDSSVVERYANDPKCAFIFSLESLLNLFAGMQEVYGEYPTPKNPQLPILFVSGYDDACGGFGKGVQEAREHIESQGYKNVGILLYKNARHEVFNEPIKQQVVDDILLWLRQNGL